MLLEGEVASFPGVGILGPDPSCGGVGGLGSAQGLARGELLAGGGEPGGVQALGGRRAFGVDGSEENGQDRHAFTGALIHP